MVRRFDPLPEYVEAQKALDGRARELGVSLSPEELPVPPAPVEPPRSPDTHPEPEGAQALESREDVIRGYEELLERYRDYESRMRGYVSFLSNNDYTEDDIQEINKELATIEGWIQDLDSWILRDLRDGIDGEFIHDFGHYKELSAKNFAIWDEHLEDYKEEKDRLDQESKAPQHTETRPEQEDTRDLESMREEVLRGSEELLERYKGYKSSMENLRDQPTEQTHLFYDISERLGKIAYCINVLEENIEKLREGRDVESIIERFEGIRDISVYNFEGYEFFLSEHKKEFARKEYALALKAYGSVWRGGRDLGGHFRFKSGEKRFDEIQKQYREAIALSERIFSEKIAQEAHTLPPEDVGEFIAKKILEYQLEEQEALSTLVREETERELWNKVKGKWKNKSFVYTRLGIGVGMTGLAGANIALASAGLATASLGAATVPMLAIRGALGAVGTTLALDAFFEAQMSKGRIGKWVDSFKEAYGKDTKGENIDNFLKNKLYVNPADIKRELDRLYALEVQTGRKIEDVPQLFFRKNKEIGKALVEGLKRYSFEERKLILSSKIQANPTPEGIKNGLMDILNNETERRSKVVKERLTVERKKKLVRRVGAVIAGMVVGVVAGSRVAKAMDVAETFGEYDAPEGIRSVVDTTRHRGAEYIERLSKHPTLDKFEESIRNYRSEDTPEIPDSGLGGSVRDTVETDLGVIDRGETASEAALEALREKRIQIPNIYNAPVKMPDGTETTLLDPRLQTVHPGDRIDAIVENGQFVRFEFTNGSGIAPGGEVLERGGRITDNSLDRGGRIVSGDIDRGGRIVGPGIDTGMDRGGTIRDTKEMYRTQAEEGLFRPRTARAHVDILSKEPPLRTLEADLDPIYKRILEPKEKEFLNDFLKKVFDGREVYVRFYGSAQDKAYYEALFKNRKDLLEMLPQMNKESLQFLDKLIADYMVDRNIEYGAVTDGALRDLRGYIGMRLGEQFGTRPIPEGVAFKTNLDEILEQARAQAKVPAGGGSLPQTTIPVAPEPPAIPVDTVTEQAQETLNTAQRPPFIVEHLSSSDFKPSIENILNYETGIEQSHLSSANESLFRFVVNNKEVLNPKELQTVLDSLGPSGRSLYQPDNLEHTLSQFRSIFVEGNNRDIIGSIDALAQSDNKNMLKLIKLLIEAEYRSDNSLYSKVLSPAEKSSLSTTFGTIQRYLTAKINGTL